MATPKDLGYDLSKIKTADLKHFALVNGMANGGYTNWQLESPYDSKKTNWLSGLWASSGTKMVLDAIVDLKQYATNTFFGHDTSVSCASFKIRNEATDPFNPKANEKSSNTVFCVSFKGSDDLLDFAHDITNNNLIGSKKIAIEAREKLFDKVAEQIRANTDGHDKIQITGHSLGGYLATEFAVYLKNKMGPEWWNKNGGKIDISTIDPIGFSEEFAKSTLTGALDPATQKHLVVKNSIAEQSRENIIIKTFFSGNGLCPPAVLKDKTVEIDSTTFSPLTLEPHKLVNLRHAMLGEMFQRQKDEGLSVRAFDIESTVPRAKVIAFRNSVTNPSGNIEETTVDIPQSRPKA